MLFNAVVVTLIAFVVSLVTRMIIDSSDVATTDHAIEFVNNAIHWKEVSVQDTDSSLRLQHSAIASTYMAAARSMCPDQELERAMGMKVKRLARELETRVMETRQNIKPKV